MDGGWRQVGNADRFMSIGAFSLGAFALWIPSGYSLGAAALFVGSLVILARRGLPPVTGRQWLVIGVMLTYAFVWMVDGLLRGEGVRELDQASRLFFAVPVLVAIAGLAIHWGAIWLGVAVGGVAALGVALVDRAAGAPRVSGFIGPEPFGHVSALLAGLSFFGALWFLRDGRIVSAGLSTAGGMAAIVALVLSGTRAGWLGFIAVVGVLAVAVWWETRPQRRLRVVAVFLMVFALVAVALGEPIKERLTATYTDVSDYYLDVDKSKSIGNRFEVWKRSLALFKQRPILGWGSVEYKREMAALDDTLDADAGELGPNHAHNEVIDGLAKKGLLGGVIVFSVFLVPAVLFARGALTEHDSDRRSLCWAGLIVVINSGMYGMAHTALENNAGVMNYAFWLAILAGSALGVDWRPVSARSGVSPAHA